jgi:hypothetical protein
MFAPDVQKKAPFGAFFHAQNPRELTRHGIQSDSLAHTSVRA